MKAYWTRGFQRVIWVPIMKYGQVRKHLDVYCMRHTWCVHSDAWLLFITIGRSRKGVDPCN